MHELEQVNASLPDLDAELPRLDADVEADGDGYTATTVFSLTSLIDSSAAAEAADRLYASNLGGVRFFSELNRAMPRARAMQTAQRLESVAMAEGPADLEGY